MTENYDGKYAALPYETAGLRRVGTWQAGGPKEDASSYERLPF